MTGYLIAAIAVLLAVAVLFAVLWWRARGSLATERAAGDAADLFYQHQIVTLQDQAEVLHKTHQDELDSRERAEYEQAERWAMERQRLELALKEAEDDLAASLVPGSVRARFRSHFGGVLQAADVPDVPDAHHP